MTNTETLLGALHATRTTLMHLDGVASGVVRKADIRHCFPVGESFTAVPDILERCTLLATELKTGGDPYAAIAEILVHLEAGHHGAAMAICKNFGSHATSPPAREADDRAIGIVIPFAGTRVETFAEDTPMRLVRTIRETIPSNGIFAVLIVSSEATARYRSEQGSTFLTSLIDAAEEIIMHGPAPEVHEFVTTYTVEVCHSARTAGEAITESALQSLLVRNQNGTELQHVVVGAETRGVNDVNVGNVAAETDALDASNVARAERIVMTALDARRAIPLSHAVFVQRRCSPFTVEAMASELKSILTSGAGPHSPECRRLVASLVGQRIGLNARINFSDFQEGWLAKANAYVASRAGEATTEALAAAAVICQGNRSSEPLLILAHLASGGTDLYDLELEREKLAKIFLDESAYYFMKLCELLPRFIESNVMFNDALPTNPKPFVHALRLHLEAQGGSLTDPVARRILFVVVALCDRQLVRYDLVELRLSEIPGTKEKLAEEGDGEALTTLACEALTDVGDMRLKALRFLVSEAYPTNTEYDGSVEFYALRKEYVREVADLL